jgi:phage major head subunit gpT-like protein
MGPQFISAEQIEITRVGFQTQFNTAFDSLKKTDNFWEQLAMVINSQDESEQYNWFGDVPAFQEWVGERKIAKVRAQSYRITNKRWANGLEVSEVDLADEKTGMYAPKIAQLAMKAQIHRINLLVDFLVNGFATTAYGAAYDGQAFFSATHQDGNGPTYSNLLTATLDDSGAYDTAWQRALEMVDESGEPLNINPTHLIVGPSNRKVARDLLLADRNANGATNTNQGTAQLYVSPKLVGAHAAKWFLVDLSKPIRPLIFQIRQDVRFQGVTGPDSKDRFMTGTLYYGADARYNAGYGLPQLAIGSNGTT